MRDEQYVRACLTRNRLSMNATVPLATIRALMDKAADARRVARDGPDGRSKSDANPMKVLAVFKSLQMKEGFVLRAYQFRSFQDGNGIVWALPVEAGYPEPRDCPKIEERFLQPSRPHGALDNPLQAIEGDRTPLSYLSASVLGRELAEFGATWHGSSWGKHAILGGPPWRGCSSLQGCYHSKTKVGEWKLSEPLPHIWSPQVRQGPDAVQVIFHVFSAYVVDSIYRHVDTFLKTGYCFTTNLVRIAEGRVG
jgi:hypothetical protein